IASDATGDWAFLRMLEKAQVKPLDDSRFELVWNGAAASGDTKAASAVAASDAASPLRYLLRVQAGAGPLDLLRLRGFTMPGRIFVPGRAGAISGLPPLPPELQP
ncbi:hypothetical protein, partial [Paraburkholderia sp. J63]|uniref:hypothetical protein n=1 Tax=Paraburkholderia sp. J63 TaxID=2805434 RepID=UPI002ABDAD2D